jgi:methionine-S-sulfoxide reductase
MQLKKRWWVGGIVIGVVLVGGATLLLLANTATTPLTNVVPSKEIDINSVQMTALSEPAAMIDSDKTASVSAETLPAVATAVFANGCFWCVEHDLEKVSGVMSAVSGYAGGESSNPTYENYAAGGHREVVEVTYNPSVVSYANLVEHILKHGDPTDAEGSFYDRGISYSPAVYYENETEKQAAVTVIAAVAASGKLAKPITVPVLPRGQFFAAEEYHQDYSKKNPIRYNYYRAASGRTKFYQSVWGDTSIACNQKIYVRKSIHCHQLGKFRKTK